MTSLVVRKWGWAVACSVAVAGVTVADPPKAEEKKPADAAKKEDDVRLGVTLDPVSKKKAADLGLAKGTGSVVTSVQPNSAAAKAGVKKDDILAELGGKAVSSEPTEFRKLVLGLPRNEPVEAVVYRDGKKETLSLAPLGMPNVVGRLEAADKPKGRLENVPTSQGAGSFNVMAAQANQDGFQIFASGEGVSYEIVGRFRNGKNIPTSIKIKDDGRVIADVKSLDKVPEGHVKAVNTLLGSVFKK
jgi:membrane-associated protease RseP (regulator of RpoE activity)